MSSFLRWSALIFVFIVVPCIYSQENTQEKDLVEREDSQSESAPLPVEVKVKDNKTQQTTTLFINSNERLFRELQEMKVALQQIQQTLDYLVNRVMADLEEENRQLKGVIQRYGLPVPTSSPPDAPISYVPGSGRNSSKRTQGGYTKENEMPEGNKMTSQEPSRNEEFYFRVIEEWGRSPEVTKQFDPNVPSVKGIVGIVPEGCPRERLQELARELRTKYDEYDNINIEVFDDEQSARDFAEKHIRNADRNVLSISKHKESGRDIITIHGITENFVP